MSCSRHPSSQGPGVCPHCLRDRLLSLLADQSPAAARGGADGGRFSLSRLFGRRRKSEDPKSGSWVHGLFRGHRRARSPRAAADEEEEMPRRASGPCPARPRGMSPAATGEESENGAESGYSTSTAASSAAPWRVPNASPMPRGAPTHRRRDRWLSALCFSPLARPRPRRERRHAGESAAEPQFSGDLRGGVAGGGAAPRWEANRSRKLADFGRFR